MTTAASSSALAPPLDALAWRPVSSRLIAVEILRWLLVLAPALVVAVLLWLAGQRVPALASAVTIIALLALRVVLVFRSVRSWGYAERAGDLLVRHGLLVRRLSIVPYSRMQFVDVRAGPLERSFRLATVELHTAAAATDARVPGLASPEAARLRDRLAALGQTGSEGL